MNNPIRFIVPKNGQTYIDLMDIDPDLKKFPQQYYNLFFQNDFDRPLVIAIYKDGSEFPKIRIEGYLEVERKVKAP